MTTFSAHQLQKTELLLLGETLRAEAAQRYQLVTKLVPTEGFEVEVLRQLNAFGSMSAQVC